MKKRIVLVEDDKDTSLLIRRLFCNTEFTLEHVASGHAILNEDDARADLYILDICLPTIDGIALTKFLRLKEREKHYPILVMSGNHASCERAKRAGASAFIGKPFDSKDFLQTVRQLTHDEHAHRI